MLSEATKARPLAAWFARSAVGFVFLINISCAIAFILQPEAYAGGFETGGVPGRVIVKGFGILFLMWNATYPPVILKPASQWTLFSVILVQQAIGLAGESWLFFGLPPGHTALRETGLRFILFDGLGFILMSVAYGLLRRSR